MPITQSAKKAIRGSLRKKAFNDQRKKVMKEIIKKIEKTVKTDKAGAVKMLSTAFQAIDKSAKFWEVVADLFPECKTGDLEPLYIFKMEETMKETVTHWVENNKPAYKDAEGKPEDWTEGMYLHYPGVWHMHHTGGGCMVVTSDNVVVAMEHRYMGITAECVMIYTDTFAEDSFLNVYDDANVWSFGDNPTVLMNIIDEWFGGSALWNTGHLFDDIMTIAKSGKC